jgi:hypothetical protein
LARLKWSILKSVRLPLQEWGRIGEDRGSKETDGCPLTGILESSNNGLELGLQTAGTGDTMGGDIWLVIGT